MEVDAVYVNYTGDDVELKGDRVGRGQNNAMSDEFAAKVEKIKQMLESDTPVESILVQLRENGTSKMESAKLLYAATGKSLREVQLLVHRSEVWADVRERDEGVHNAIIDYLGKSNQKQPGD